MAGYQYGYLDANGQHHSGWTPPSRPGTPEFSSPATTEYTGHGSPPTPRAYEADPRIAGPHARLPVIDNVVAGWPEPPQPHLVLCSRKQWDSYVNLVEEVNICTSSGLSNLLTLDSSLTLQDTGNSTSFPIPRGISWANIRFCGTRIDSVCSSVLS